MKKLKRQIKIKLIKAMLRYSRKVIISSMRANGFTWAKINQVLHALGLQQIAVIERCPNNVIRFKNAPAGAAKGILPTVTVK